MKQSQNEGTQADKSPIGLDIVTRLAEGYRGIEEVTDPDNGEDVIDGDEVTGQGNIEEVTDPSEDANVIEGGEVFFRNGITIAIVTIWTMWNALGLVTYMKTGDSSLLITSQAVLNYPLHRVLGYHFRN